MTPAERECEDFDNLHTQNLHHQLAAARVEIVRLRAALEHSSGCMNCDACRYTAKRALEGKP